MNNIAAITCFFNFEKNDDCLKDFLVFKGALENQNIPLFVIEITVEGTVPSLRNVFDKDRYTTESTILPILIKGNALNVLSSRIPEEYENIAWLNCNTIIKNENWAEEASLLLDKCKLIKVGKDSCHESPMVVRRDFFETIGLFDHDFCGNTNLVTFSSATNFNLLNDADSLLELYQNSNLEIFYKILSYKDLCYNYFKGEVGYLESTTENISKHNTIPLEKSISLLKNINVDENIEYSGLHKPIAMKNIHRLNYSSEMLNLLKKV